MMYPKQRDNCEAEFPVARIHPQGATAISMLYPHWSPTPLHNSSLGLSVGESERVLGGVWDGVREGVFVRDCDRVWLLLRVPVRVSVSVGVFV